MNTKEGPKFGAVITDIQPANILGAEGDFSVAIVEKTDGAGEAWYPLPKNHELGLDDEVVITPVTTHHDESGGSSTIYRLELIQE